MSLLDDVSIVITPNAYNVSTLYAVIPTPSEGDEEVNNNDFSTASDWTPQTGWTVAGNGVATVDSSAAGTTNLTSTGMTVIVGRTYLAEMYVDSSSGSGIRFDLGGVSSGSYLNTTGLITATIIATSTAGFVITASSSDTVSQISRVSVKEYTSADMDVTRETAATRVDENGLVNYAEILGGDIVTNGNFTTDLSGWTITGTDATHTVTWTETGARYQSDTTSPVLGLAQVFFEVGKTYTVTCNIAYAVGSGTLRCSIGGVNQSAFTEGFNTRTSVALSYTNLTFLRNSTDVDAIISKVIVKEVTRDNVPRIDYTGGGCPHILAEPQRENELTYSEDFSNAAWGTLGTITVTSDDTTSPSGDLSADKVLGLDSGSAINQIVNGTSGIEYTNSCYIKNVDATSSNLLIRNASSAVSSLLNWSGSVLSSITNTTGITTFTDEGNGWYRIISTYTSIEATQRPRIYPAIGTANTSVYIWGAQLEVGSYATSYIPTSGTTVTRNQDIFTRDGISSLINSPEGVLFVEMAALSDDGTSRDISVSDGTSANYARISLSNAVGNIEYNVVVGSSTQASGTSAMTQTNFNKIAVKWKVNDFALWVNGSEVLTELSGTSFSSSTLTTLNFDRGSGTNPLYAKVKQLQVYDTALTDEQLLQLTGESGTDFYESYAEMAAALTYTLQ